MAASIGVLGVGLLDDAAFEASLDEMRATRSALGVTLKADAEFTNVYSGHAAGIYISAFVSTHFASLAVGVGDLPILSASCDSLDDAAREVGEMLSAALLGAICAAVLS